MYSPPLFFNFGLCKKMRIVCVDVMESISGQMFVAYKYLGMVVNG